MTIYERIYNLCERDNITGVELGKKLGLKKSPLTDWRNQKAKPTIEQIIKMCEIFAISSDYLLMGINNGIITDEEKEIIEAYRRAEPPIQTATKKILDVKEKREISSVSKTG